MLQLLLMELLGTGKLLQVHTALQLMAFTMGLLPIQLLLMGLLTEGNGFK